MREGGILDGFPLHLLAGENDETVVLVLDDPELGRLGLNPVPAGRRTVVAVARDRSSLEHTRQAVGREILLVQADPERLPFGDGSIRDVVALSRQAGTTPEAGPGGPSEAGRVLGTNGSMVGMHRVARRPDTTEPSGERHYYVRPASGHHYFVTREWLPACWPLGNLQLGRIQSLKLAASRLGARWGIGPLYDGVRLAVRSGSPGMVERWGGGALALSAKSGRNAVLIGAREPAPSGPPAVVKFPLSTEAAQQLERHATALQGLEGVRGLKVPSVFPRLLGRGIFAGQQFCSESQAAGMTASNLWWIPGGRRKASVDGFRHLLDLHRSSARPTVISREVFERLVGPPSAAVEPVLRRLDPAASLDPLIERLSVNVGGWWIPLVRTHGDFGPENLLVSRELAVTGIPDWESSRDQGWPLLDLLNLLSVQRKWSSTKRFGSRVIRKLAPARLAPWERRLVEEYRGVLGIDLSLWRSMVALYWLETVALYIRTDPHEGWLRRNLVDTLPRVLDFLEPWSRMPARADVFVRRHP